MFRDRPAGPKGSTSSEVVRWQTARFNFEDAERRGAPVEVLQILEEAVIAARISMLRAAERGGVLTAAERNQLVRDQELLRRFPGDRAGDAGSGWFDWPVGSARGGMPTTADTATSIADPASL